MTQTPTHTRTHPRLSVSGPLVGSLLIEGTDEAIDCRPFEVSNGGLGIWTNVPLFPGMNLRLHTDNDDGSSQGDVRLRVKYCLKNHLNTQLFRCGLESIDSKIDFFGAREGLKIVAEKNNAAISVDQDTNFQQSRPTRYVSRTEAALHDVRNYLLVVQSAAELLQYEPQSEESKANVPQLARRILKAVGQLTHCADDIHADLNSYRVEEWQSFSAQDLLHDASEMCRGLLDSNGIEIQISVPHKKVNIFGTPKALLRVMLNLLINAKDAALKSEDKWIHLDLSEANGFVRIKISDSGILRKEDRSKVFTPFFSTKAPVSRQMSGIGLAFTKSVIEYHGGSIYVDENAPETFFVIEIPSSSRVST